MMFCVGMPLKYWGHNDSLVTVAGIVFVSGLHADTTANPDRYQRLIERNLPIVLINGYMPGIDAPFFSVDDRAAMHMAVQHLAGLGHEYLAYAAGPEASWADSKRWQSLRDAAGDRLLREYEQDRQRAG